MPGGQTDSLPRVEMETDEKQVRSLLPPASVRHTPAQAPAGGTRICGVRDTSRRSMASFAGLLFLGWFANGLGRRGAPGRGLWALVLQQAAWGAEPCSTISGPAAEAACGAAIARHGARPQRRVPGGLCVWCRAVSCSSEPGTAARLGGETARLSLSSKGRRERSLSGSYWIIPTCAQAGLGATAEASGRGCPLSSVPGCPRNVSCSPYPPPAYGAREKPH